MTEAIVKTIRNSRVYDVAEKTPLNAAPSLSQRLDNEILIKREDLQPVFSFKLRGAYQKMSGLSEAEKAAGVIAASAGNHAQGLALAAQRLSIKAVIVMPKTTPEIKVNSVRVRGADIVLHGNTYDEASEHAHKLAEETGAVFVHPYDDVDVIAGQGTVGLEIMDQCEPAPDIIFVPVGGGGLIAGIASYVKAVSPNTKIIGVEPDDAPCMERALATGERVVLDSVGLFADGVAVRQVGEETFRIAKDLVDEVILVSTDEICAAIKDMFDELRTIAEPAGALAIAGIKRYVAREGVTGQRMVAILSGANVNFDRLRHIAERAEIGEQREVLLAATIPERPGSFLDFCHALGPRGITEFNYRYADDHTAHVFTGVQLRHGDPGREALIESLREKGFGIVDMTDNEMAKLHVRYMVGGHAGSAKDEVLYRFQFPERPGALLLFLGKLGERWNISLFHYRNHGDAFGRVFVGVQVPDAERAELTASLDALGYPYWEETDNEAYRVFLG